MSEPQSSKFREVLDAEWTFAPPEHKAGAPEALALHAEPHATLVPTGELGSRVVVLEEIELPAARNPRLVVLDAPGSAQARGYRLLQHRLLAGSDPRVIAVTSAGPGEGKTTCAVNLALVLADQTFARVLLIDANVRRPGLRQVFAFEPETSFIAKIVEDREAAPPYLVASLRGSGLHIAALRPDRVKSTHLDRLLLDMAVSELRHCYDYIVIDAASVFESGDADVVAECADGVVLTARARRSKKSALRRAVDQLSPAPVLGVVLLDT